MAISTENSTLFPLPSLNNYNQNRLFTSPVCSDFETPDFSTSAKIKESLLKKDVRVRFGPEMTHFGSN